MTLARHGSIIVAALLAALALAAPAGAQETRALIVFHPGGEVGDEHTVFERLVERSQLSIGLLGATQGPYSVRQTLLDFTQGSRISKSGYDPRAIPNLRLRGRRILGWRRAVQRADSAPAELVPGLLAASVPGGAAYVGVGRVGVSHAEAIAAAGRDGRIAKVRLGLENEVADNARELLGRYRVVVASLPRGDLADRQLDELIATRRAGELLLVIRTPPRSRAPQLLPAGAIGIGESQPGLLRSRTTRRAGLVASHDVLPTVLTHLGIPIPDDVRGRPMFVTPPRDAVYLRRLERRLRVVFPRRYPTLLWVAGALAAVALLGLVTRRRALALRTIGLALMWLPAMVLVTAALAPTRIAEKAIVAFGCIAAALLTDRLVPWPRAPALPALAGVTAYVVDLFFGSHLIVRSLLGPNPRFGARWFGIGNELEAILPVLLLVGLAAAAGMAARSTRLAALFAAAMGALGAATAAGRLGADVGGVFTVGAGGAVAVLLALPGALTKRRLAIACAVPLAGLAALALVDVVTGGDSHFATTVLGAEDAGALWDVVTRRTSLAFDSFMRGLMPVATILAVVALVLGWRRRDRILAPVRDRPAWAAALAGGAAAGIVGTLTNDSGPVLLVIGMVSLLGAVSYLAGESPPRGIQPPELERPHPGDRQIARPTHRMH